MIADDSFEAAAEKLLKEYRIASDELVVDITLTTNLWAEHLSRYGSFEMLTKGLKIDGIHSPLRYVIIHNYVTESEMVFCKGLLVPGICDEVPFMNGDAWDRIKKETDSLCLLPWRAKLREQHGWLTYSIPLTAREDSPFTEEKFKEDPGYVCEGPFEADRVVLMKLHLGQLRRLFRSMYLEQRDPIGSQIEQDNVADLAKHLQYTPEGYFRHSWSNTNDAVSHVFKNEYVEITVGYSCTESYFFDSIIDLVRNALSSS